MEETRFEIPSAIPSHRFPLAISYPLPLPLLVRFRPPHSDSPIPRFSLRFLLCSEGLFFLFIAVLHSSFFPLGLHLAGNLSLAAGAVGAATAVNTTAASTWALHGNGSVGGDIEAVAAMLVMNLVDEVMRFGCQGG